VDVSAATVAFEAPIDEVLARIEALSLLPRTPERQRDIEDLRARVTQLRKEIYANLSPWQRVLVARHPTRPHTLDYIARLFTDFTEIHGDRRFGDDPAIVAGFARFDGQHVLVVGHQKGRGTRDNVYRNFGYARPEGFRKALRAMKLAEKFARPVVALVDTPAAYPGVDSEERGVAEAIAVNLRELAMLTVPVVVAVIGEGGSGGALGLAVGDVTLMQEYAVYSVIPPEGCAAILWRDATRKTEAAAALKITASDQVSLGVVDQVVPEPLGGAHTDVAEAARLLGAALSQAVPALVAAQPDVRLQQRHDKLRRLGLVGVDGR